jgi:hypothetical protein
LNILLGFEIPTGNPVRIPLGHLVVTGQTQLSGKTTTLEAMISRSGLKAIAFVTKRGEGSFQTARTIPPYFSEPTNDEEQPLWMWVKGILESSQRRTLNFQESWIIEACERPELAETLKDVHENIQALLTGQSHIQRKSSRSRIKDKVVWDRRPVQGLARGVYTSLNAYFKIVLPQLARLPYTKKLALGPGLNVMDLSDYAPQTQGLVIRSVLEWVYLRETNVISIIPEAWEFVPQGKNSPVRMAAETYARKAAGLHNFLWLDSQDLAGVDKVMLRGVSVWLFGAQRQKNEIDRTLDSIPQLAPKPTATQIATLDIGQFYVCYGKEIRHVYVQPVWMESEIHAQAIARGEESLTSAGGILKKFKRNREESDEETAPRDDSHTGQPESDASNADLLDRHAPGLRGGVSTDEEAGLHGENHPSCQQNPSAEDLDAIAEETRAREATAEPEEEMSVPMCLITDLSDGELKQKHDELARKVGELADELARRKNLGGSGNATAGRPAQPAEAVRNPQNHGARGGEGGGYAGEELGAGARPLESSQHPSVPDWLYQGIRDRALKEGPQILELLIQRPELRVKIERPVLEVDAKSNRGRVAILLHAGFFKQPVPVAAVVKECERRGFVFSKPRMYEAVDQVAEIGFLTKEDGGFQAVPGMKVSTVEK